MRRNTTGDSSTTVEDSTIFLRIHTVIRMTGLGRSAIYKMVADQSFPGPVRIGVRAVAWRRSDLERWSKARPSAVH
jgi:prophage regulatory protein